LTQNVALLPNGRQQFLDPDGVPLVGGTVGMYIPGTLTPQTTYQNIGGTIQNDNPLTLDDLGSAAIWGLGSFRQIVKYANGDVLWDEDTSVSSAAAFQALGEIILTWTGTQPNATTWLGGESIAVAQTILATAPGSTGITPKTLPTATYTITIKQNGTQIGTATMLSGGGAWSFTFPSQVSLAVGDDIDFYGSGDATIANFGITLKTQIS
jgi:hypothetical protein